ncbi:antibiotic biosynthesis monooxygenase [Variovorax sp. ZS18.2.2]|uniref:putative quinol monooxygenase n=1 Tax=Variovorax sp. ZS18.2.2 TaxID=2971255 RepID=UPI0021517FC5|nr:putative quinol monooxygenase [Variovorax sp. ZS18.2.2]MCR6474876.1 antibiotic biosynthesis monooxygenase [Variovorax sp. ZS18.2.2]
MSTAPLISIAILKAKAGQREALRAALSALVPSTRQEPGCLDYTLFELRDEPGSFYMRESFRDQAALDTHFATPYFQAFEKRFDELLDAPIRLVFLEKIA